MIIELAGLSVSRNHFTIYALRIGNRCLFRWISWRHDEKHLELFWLPKWEIVTTEIPF